MAISVYANECTAERKCLALIPVQMNNWSRVWGRGERDGGTESKGREGINRTRVRRGSGEGSKSRLMSQMNETSASPVLGRPIIAAARQGIDMLFRP